MIPTRRSILLLQPPFYRLYDSRFSLDRFPLSLAYLAGAARSGTGWDVRALNADFTPDSRPMTVRYRTGPGFRRYLDALADPSAPVWRELATRLAEIRPAVLGITAKSQEFASARMAARLAKQLDPATLVVVGGPHPSMVGAEVLRWPEIDVFVRGEGERTVVELLRAIESGAPLAGVRGIGFRDGNAVVETPPREYLEDLDALEFPHRVAPEVLVGHADYPVEAFRYVFASRGCPRSCLFCGSRRIWSRRVRFRSPANVVEELRSLMARGIREVHFDDDVFGVDHAHLRRLCDALRDGCPGLRWSCEIHVGLADDDSVLRMKEAGCTSIQLGIESGNDAILEKVRKRTTVRAALEACATIQRHGIELHAFFMVGFPWETEATLRDTVRALRRTRCDTVSYSIFTPYQGTEAFEECRALGLVDETFDPSRHNHQSPENCFCREIPRERFRRLVAGIERTVDRKNARARWRRRLSIRGMRSIGRRGLRLVRRSLRRPGPAGS